MEKTRNDVLAIAHHVHDLRASSMWGSTVSCRGGGSWKKCEDENLAVMAVSELVKCGCSDRACMCVDAKLLVANARKVRCLGSPSLRKSCRLMLKSKRPTLIQKWCLITLICANVAPTLGVEAEARCNVNGIIDLSGRGVRMLVNGPLHLT